jgi:hypothetical protein
MIAHAPADARIVAHHRRRIKVITVILLCADGKIRHKEAVARTPHIHVATPPRIHAVILPHIRAATLLPVRVAWEDPIRATRVAAPPARVIRTGVATTMTNITREMTSEPSWSPKGKPAR